MRRLRFLIPLTALLLAACGPQEPPTPRAEDIQTAIAETQAAEPTETNTAAPTETPEASATTGPTVTRTQTPSQTPSGPIDAEVAVLVLNMRDGPGTMHAVVGNYREGDPVTIVARALGNEWVKVDTADDETGWMFTTFLQLQGDLDGVAVEPIPEFLTIVGQVHDTEGEPVDGVNIAVVSGTGASALRTDAFSDENGSFYAYIPEDLLGTLDVSIVGVDCASRIMDEGCNIEGVFRLQGRTFVNIPQSEAILFEYEVATKVIEGTVVDENGDPVPDISVIGERSDGAQSFVIADAEGNFSLPVGEGDWELYAVVFDPNRAEGERVAITIIGETDPPPQELLAP
jgi:hypothetical protein